MAAQKAESTINHTSKIPLYQQLYTILRQAILDEQWASGEMIPTESEFIEQYGVSRTTVRQVLDLLVAEGFIFRQRGKGSFVAPPRLEQQMSRIVNFADDIRRRGLIPRTILVEAKYRKASAPTAELLNVPVDGELVSIHRLRLANDEPLSLEESYLVPDYVPGILENHDFATESLEDILSHDYNIVWQSAKQTIRAVSATREIAKLLKESPGSALLFIERISRDQRDRPVEFLRIYYHGRYCLYNELSG